MRKSNLWLGAALLVALSASAYDIVRLTLTDGTNREYDASKLKEIRYSGDKSQVVVEMITGETESVAVESLKDMRFDRSEQVINVNFNGESAEVINGYSADEVSVNIDGAKVEIHAAEGVSILCHASGSSETGQLKVYSDSPVKAEIEDLNLTNDAGAPLNFQTTAAVEVELIGASVISDSKKYSTPEGESEKGTIHCGGPLTLSGDGSLQLTAIKKHAINCDFDVTLNSGAIEVLSSASDGVHSEGFAMMAAHTSRPKL